ncbi:peptidase M23 [Streptomyces laurentii]|uniref:Peptidase M23 n=1 Tax=Streptomyces laurentii TaxID=39478 RepID=A0A160NWN5_STRLU|nr:peptidase M23 [Streptomyces laurentii]
MRGGLADGGGGAFGDAAAPFVAEDEGHGGLRDAGYAGDVAAGGAVPAGGLGAVHAYDLRGGCVLVRVDARVDRRGAVMVRMTPSRYT